MQTPNGMSPNPGESTAAFERRMRAYTDKYMAAIDRKERRQEEAEKPKRKSWF